MTNIFSELKNMDHQLASALSTMLKLRLVVFLHFDKHAVENAQKAMLCMIPICQFGFLTPNVDFIRNNKAVYASYWDVRDDLERQKVILLVFESHRNTPFNLGNTLSTSVDLRVDQNAWKYGYYGHISLRVVLDDEFL